MRRIGLLFALLTVAGLRAGAQESISVGEVLVPEGRQAMMEVMFHFSEGHDYVSYQFTVNLPEGISLVTNANGKVPVTLGDGQDEDIYTLDLNATSRIVTCYSNPSTPIGGTDGVLVRIPVEADAEVVSAGDVLEGTLTDVEFTHNEGAVRTPFASVSFSVGVTGQVILDESYTWVPYATDAACDLLVKRTIKAGEWSTICFPFAMSVDKLKAAFGDDYDLEEFTGYDVEKDGDNKVTGLTLNFTRNTKAAKINTPYVIKTGLDVDITEFAVNAKVNPGNTRKAIMVEDDESGEEVEIASMTGTLRAGTVVPMNGLFLSGNKFWYSTGKTQIKAFRAYFELSDVLASVAEANDNVRLSFGDDGTTGVSVEVVREQPTDDTLFDLQGRRVTTPSHGLYVRQGRKVVVK